MLLVPVWYREVMVERKAFQLRLPIGLHAELVGAARAARRSLNSEIVWRLEALTEPGEEQVASRSTALPPSGSEVGSESRALNPAARGSSAFGPDPGSASASGLSSEPFEESP